MVLSNELINVRITRKTREADDIASFELQKTDGENLPVFEPGAHIDVHIPGGPIRQYSLCNPCHETTRYVIAVLRDPCSRGGSEAIHGQLHVGDIVQISAPRNHFPLHTSSGYSLLMAGGIGITPLLCMADRLFREEQPFDLHYCARSLSRTAFHEALVSVPYAGQVHFHFDDEEDQTFDFAKQMLSCPTDAHLYVCGPRGFMDAVLSAARQTGWTDDRIHYEYFSADVACKDDDRDFEVEIASSGEVVTVARNQSIIAALAQAGVDISMSCEQGICGTCLTRVISGIPDHRDSFLLPGEKEKNDQILPCCSRSKSKRLVLDL